MSIGDSFQRLAGSSSLSRKRCSWDSSLTLNQYLMRIMPERASMRSNSGTVLVNSLYSSSVQNPITFSTPARLYQLRSKKTISPPEGSWAT